MLAEVARAPDRWRGEEAWLRARHLRRDNGHARAVRRFPSGGIRAIDIRNGQLVEVGGYLDPNGNDFWGVESFVGAHGKTYVSAATATAACGCSVGISPMDEAKLSEIVDRPAAA